MLGCSVLMVGAALQTSSYVIPQLIVGRIVTGLGNGINTSTVPVWHSETTAAHSRGRALAIELAVNICMCETPAPPSPAFPFQILNPPQSASCAPTGSTTVFRLSSRKLSFARLLPFKLCLPWPPSSLFSSAPNRHVGCSSTAGRTSLVLCLSSCLYTLDLASTLS